MKAIIVDDEPAVRNTISTLLKESFSGYNCKRTGRQCTRKVIAAVTEHQPDLLFLDVELPDGLGFDLLKRLSPVTFQDHLHHRTPGVCPGCDKGQCARLHPQTN